jgi:drug/metabolite transporter (DMT)-like permease
MHASPTLQGMTPLYGQPQHYGLLLLRGMSGSMAMLCYYSALYMLPLADAVTINLVKPPLAAALAWLLLGEAFPLLGWAGLLASLAGVVLVAHPPFLFGGHHSWGLTRLEGVAIDLASAGFGASE